MWATEDVQYFVSDGRSSVRKSSELSGMYSLWVMIRLWRIFHPYCLWLMRSRVLDRFLDGCGACQFLPGIVASNTRLCVPFSCQYNLGVYCTSLFCQSNICLNKPSIAHFEVCKDKGRWVYMMFSVLVPSFSCTFMHACIHFCNVGWLCM